MLGRLAMPLCLMAATTARAGSVTISVDPAGGDTLAGAMGITRQEVETQLSAQLSEAFNLLEPGDYVQALADAQAFSNKGLGVDYASNPTGFVIGVAGNFAVDAGDEGLGKRYQDRPVVGAAPNASFLLGLNMGVMGFDDLTLYGNYFAQRRTFQKLDVALNNLGLHAQLKFFRPEGDGLELLFQWGGFDLTTGVEWSSLAVSLDGELETDAPLTGPAAEVPARFLGTGRYDLDASSFAIPIELTTNFRVLYIVSLFGGVGFDVQTGTGSMKVALDGRLEADNPAGGAALDLGTARVEVTEDAEPSAGRVRFIGGLQLNLSMVKVFVQANRMPPGAYSAGAGVRLAW